MDGTSQKEPSQLFLVRLWLDAGAGEGQDWHGHVQHVVSGTAGTFSSQEALVELLKSLAFHAQASDPVTPTLKIGIED